MCDVFVCEYVHVCEYAIYLSTFVTLGFSHTYFSFRNEDPMTDTYFAFGWLLFIVVGNQVQEWLSDFETCYHVFASTMLFFWENAHIADLKIMNVPKGLCVVWKRV